MNLGRQYSSAIISLAKEQKKLNQLYEDCAVIVGTLESEFARILTSYSIDDETKFKMIDTVYKKTTDISKNTLKLLVTKKQIKYAGSVFQKVRSTINKINNVAEGTLYSTIDIKPLDKKKIETQLSKKLNKKVDLKVLLDKSLISGMKVEIDSKTFDYSAKGMLEQMRSKIMEGEI